MIFSINKQAVFCVVVAIIMSLITVLIPASYAVKNVKYTVVIDAGHGGIDGGAVGSTTKVSESELNLDISKKLKTLFESVGFIVVLTRENSDGLYGDESPGFKKRDMQKRAEIIRESDPNVLISVHLNKYTSSSRRGAQVFYKSDSESSKNLADSIQKNLNQKLSVKKNYTALKGDYFLLNTSKCTAVIVECGFLSNKEEEQLLCNEDYRQNIASVIFEGTINYLSYS